MGFTVAHTHQIGSGFPDIVIGWTDATGKHNTLIEIKDGDKPPSARKLTTDEEKWHSGWLGDVVIIYSVDDVLSFHKERVRG